MEDSKSKPGNSTHDWVEEIEVTGEKLVAEVKRLAAESRVRRLRVIEPDGDVAVDVSLPVGAIAGGAVVLAAPVLAVIGALAALVAKVKIEIIRDPDAPAEDESANDGAAETAGDGAA